LKHLQAVTLSILKEAQILKEDIAAETDVNRLQNKGTVIWHKCRIYIGGL
jgi:hypothetical protein